MLKNAVIMTVALILAPGAYAAGSLAECDQALYEEIRDNTVEPLFVALSNGDISGIRRHLSDRMKSEYEALFTQNANYGQFLREFYAGGQFELVDVISGPDGYEAMIRLQWADGRSTQFNLGLGGEQGMLARSARSENCGQRN